MSLNNRPGAWSRQPPPQGQQINPAMFAGQVNLAQPFAAQQMALAPGFNPLVNQAAFSNMNNAALAAAQLQRQLIPQQQQQQQRQPSPPQSANQRTPSQRTFVGIITKLMDNYGFVDEDVFFQTSVIRGSMPRVGDRVMVEATFNPSMPFKWNAFRIQSINEPPQQQSHQAPPQQHQASSFTSRQQPQTNRWGDRVERSPRDARSARGPSPQDRYRSMRRPSPPPRRDDRQPIRRSPPPRRSSPPPRRASPIRREPPPKRERERTPVRDNRDSRPPATTKRDDSPPRRRQRIIPRYQCYTPRPLAQDSMNYTDLHKRYTNLYIPSDFVRAELSWKQSFNLENPITFSPNAIDFHILHKDVDYPFADSDPLPTDQPEDADPRYIVKVLLLSHPGATAIRQKVTGLLADGSLDETVDAQTLFKILHFVVGYRGKSEVMGIGGAWSPSLDGENPLDPQTLIKTAVRTTRAMTGVDLSKCPTWYKMLHLRYFRAERDRYDHVVLLLPDTAATPNFLPAADVYQTLTQEVLPGQLKQKLAQIDEEPFVPQSEAAKKVQADKEEKAATAAKLAEAAANSTAGFDKPADTTNSDTPDKPADITTTTTTDGAPVADTTMDESTGQVAAADSENADAATAAESTETAAPDSKKVHWSKLNVKSLKVAELREQLDARGLDSKGVKNTLAQRLQEAVDAEKLADESTDKQDAIAPTSDDIVMVDEDNGDEVNPDELIVKDEAEEEMDTAEATEHKTDKPVEVDFSGAKNAYVISRQPVLYSEEAKEGETKDEPMEQSKTESASSQPKEQPKAEEKPVITRKEKEEYEKEVDRFEKSKKERKSALERHYSFPKEPTVFIYPHKTAKGGKFDCRSVSMQSLLDYRLDDNKEASFEAFLFAEALREAVDRDFAFGVYHTLNSCLDKESERARRDEALTKVETPPEAGKTDETPNENGVETTTDDKEKSEGEKAEKKESDEKEKSVAKEDKKEKSVVKDEKTDPRLDFRALVNDVKTFTIFCHFDQNICGYLADRDLEEILYTLGLDISRASIQRLVRKVSSRERFNYRNVTDKWVDKDSNVKYVPEPLPVAPTRAQLLKWLEDEEESEKAATPAAAAGGSTPDVTQSGVLFYKGTVMNIGQAMEQHKLVDNERSEALLKIQELEHQLKSVKDQRDYSDKKRKRLESDVDHYKKKFYDAEKCLKTSQDDTVKMKTSLMDAKKLGERLVGLVEKTLPPPPAPEPKKEETADQAKNGTDQAKNGTDQTKNGTDQAKDADQQPKDVEPTKTDEKTADQASGEKPQPAAEDQPKAVANAEPNASQETITIE